jgi:hypothetical protein
MRVEDILEYNVAMIFIIMTQSSIVQALCLQSSLPKIDNKRHGKIFLGATTFSQLAASSDGKIVYLIDKNLW